MTAAERATFDPSAEGWYHGLHLGQVVLAILGVLVTTSEYGPGTIRATLAAVPNRSRILAAKTLGFGGLARAVRRSSGVRRVRRGPTDPRQPRPGRAADRSDRAARRRPGRAGHRRRGAARPRRRDAGAAHRRRRQRRADHDPADPHRWAVLPAELVDRDQIPVLPARCSTARSTDRAPDRPRTTWGSFTAPHRSIIHTRPRCSRPG